MKRLALQIQELREIIFSAVGILDPLGKLPLRAFDDGRQVFIAFPTGIGQGEMPPLWVIGPAGGAELVNYRIQGNHMIVDRLFAAAELRLGGEQQKKVRIVRTDGRPQS